MQLTLGSLTLPETPIRQFSDEMGLIRAMFSPFIIEAHGGFGNEAKQLVRELERRRRERECQPNIRGKEAFQSLGEINLVTAIGFELVRRNVRMILDRSPEEEPLIPAEKTKIRMEMTRKKQRSERSIKGGYDDNCVSGLDLVEEDHKECPLVSKQGKVIKANKDYAVGKPPETTAGPGGDCSVDAGMTDRRKELQGVVKLGRMEEKRVSPADTSVSKTCEYQRDSTSKDDAGSCSGENLG